MSRQASAESVCAGALGVWLALVLLKLGTPVILDSQVPVPTTQEEILVASWPVRWGYILTCAALLVGIHRFRWPRGVPLWLMIAPLVWLGWQGLSAIYSLKAVVEPNERHAVIGTLGHFATCSIVFYYGAGVASRIRRLTPLWLGLGGGFLVVLVVGWQQHFGGLEETRQFFFSQPDWRTYPPEFIQKISSDRIYSTLFYPNALAGVILLLLPVCIAQLWGVSRNRPAGPPGPQRLAARADAGSSRRARSRGPAAAGDQPRAARAYSSPSMVFGTAALAGIAAASVGCLYWSGSKAGWLILLGQCLVTVLWAPLRLRTKSFVLGAMLIMGVVGFGLRHQGYLAKGATSVSARFDYWRVAWQALGEKPLLGSGPGTFAATYKRLKPPGAEVTRLAHNDLLQQGADSGWIGMLAYSAWLYGGVGFVALGWRRRPGLWEDWARFGIWLGLLGLLAQSLVEFWLYIPSIAWPAFFLLGFLLATRSSERGIP